MYASYLDEFLPSGELREWLKTTSVSPWEITSLIFYAPASLIKKKPALTSLLREAEVMKQKDLAEQCRSFLHDLDLAEKMLTEDGIFTVENCGYDEDIDDTSTYLVAVCDSFDEAKDLVRKDWEENEYDSDCTCWHEVKKWVRKDGKYTEACGYVFIEKEACLLDPSLEMRDAFFHRFYDGADLRLTLPYKPGDILEIDCMPFRKKGIVIVGQNLHPDDCCSPQVLSKGKAGKWSFGALKHGDVFGLSFCDLGISALYRLRTLHDFVPVTDDDKLIAAVKECIDQSNVKDSFYEKTWAGSYTKDELLKKINEQNQEQEHSTRRE